MTTIEDIERYQHGQHCSDRAWCKRLHETIDGTCPPDQAAGAIARTVTDCPFCSVDLTSLEWWKRARA